MASGQSQPSSHNKRSESPDTNVQAIGEQDALDIGASVGHKKNLVVCCDGSWCGQQTGTRTNIEILARAFAGPQATQSDKKKGKLLEMETYKGNGMTNLVRYFDGVGVKGSMADYFANGALALDIDERCVEAYKFIVEQYTEDAKVWMFGLSRGAYTVRCVAGMINNCGILQYIDDAEDRHLACEEVYRIYRNKDKRYHPSSDFSIQFRKDHSHANAVPHVRFMGLLDTVGALGVPDVNAGTHFDYFGPKLYDQVVSWEVQTVCQLVLQRTCVRQSCFRAVASFSCTMMMLSRDKPFSFSFACILLKALALTDRMAPFTPCFVRRLGDDASQRKKKNPAAPRAGNHADQGDNTKRLARDSSNHGKDKTRYQPRYTAKYETEEAWFPGSHYDIGRQRFVLFRATGDKLEQSLHHHAYNGNSFKLNATYTPALADPPFKWLLKKIKDVDEHVLPKTAQAYLDAYSLDPLPASWEARPPKTIFQLFLEGVLRRAWAAFCFVIFDPIMFLASLGVKAGREILLWLIPAWRAPFDVAEAAVTYVITVLQQIVGLIMSLGEWSPPLTIDAYDHAKITLERVKLLKDLLGPVSVLIDAQLLSDRHIPRHTRPTFYVVDDDAGSLSRFPGSGEVPAGSRRYGAVEAVQYQSKAFERWDSLKDPLGQSLPYNRIRPGDLE